MQQPSETRAPKTVFLMVLGISALSVCLMGVCVAAVVLFPVFAHSRERARNVGCINNLKQLGQACALYAQDHCDQLPPASTWMDAITPYLTEPYRQLRCPSVHEGFGYAFNSRFSRAALGELSPDQGRVPLIYDSVNLARNATDPLTSLPDPPRHRVERQHNNALFADGSARAIDSSTP